MKKKTKSRLRATSILLVVLCAGALALWRFTPLFLRPEAVKPSAEQNAAAFQRRIDAVDEVLRRSLAALGKGPAALQSVTPHRHAGRNFGFQTYRLPAVDHATLREEIAKRLAQSTPFARLSEPSTREWGVYVDGVQTHRLILPAMEVELPPAPAPAPVRPKKAKARLALVIDDMGENVPFARDLAALDIPVAFSVWPDSGHRKAVIRVAKTNGLEILIHLPMQPTSYPRVNPGPHALLVGMSPEEIQALTLRAIRREPDAIGLNNHMGSALTENAKDIRAVLEVIQEKGLFFLDSVTTPHSAGSREAKKLGLRHYRRNVFLDNVQSPRAILRQLRDAEAVAKRHGQAIAIGHPHPATLAGLRLWLKEKDPGVRLVPLSTLAPE